MLARTLVPRSCKCHWSSAKVYRLSNAWSQLNMVRILSRQSQGGSTPECRSVPLESDVDPQRSEGEGHPMFNRLRHGQDHEDMTYHYCSCRWRLGFIFMTLDKCQTSSALNRVQMSNNFVPSNRNFIFFLIYPDRPHSSFLMETRPRNFQAQTCQFKQRTGHVFCAGLKKCRCCLPS